MAVVLNTQLILDPNNQIAHLADFTGLVDGTEYVISANFLATNTRFVFYGNFDIALTQAPIGVPSAQTEVPATISTVPLPAVATPPAAYPYILKDRLIAVGLNRGFEFNPGSTPPTGNAGGAGTYSYWIDTSTTLPTLRQCVAAPRAAAGVYHSNEWVTLGTVDAAAHKFHFDLSGVDFLGGTGDLYVNGGIHTTGPSAGLYFADRDQTSPTWLWMASAGVAYLQLNGVTKASINGAGSLSIASVVASGTVTANAVTTNVSVTANAADVAAFWAPNGGITVNGVVHAGGQITGDAGLTINGTGVGAIYAPNGGITANGSITAGGAVHAYGVITGETALLINGTGAGAIYAPNGGITAHLDIVAGGSMTAGGAAHVVGQITSDTAFYTAAGGAGAFYAPNGGITVGGVMAAGGAITAGGVVDAVGQITSHTAFYTAAGVAGAFYAPNGGITVGGGMTAGGGITSGGVVHAVGQIIGDAGLTINGTGSGAIYAPNGGITTGGSFTAAGGVTAAGTITSDASFYTTGAGTGAFYAPNGSLAVGHDVQCAQGWKPGGGMWSDSSDARTKTDIADYTRGLDAVMQLRPVSFRHNGRGETVDDGKTYIGLVADEVRSHMPEMVGTIDRKLDPGDEHSTEISTVEATALLYAMLNAVKELNARLIILET